MKIRYIAAFALGLSLASCNLLDKEPSGQWDSNTAIKNLQDLEFAVNGVYESQTNSIDGGANPRGSYAADFGLYADMKGSDYMVIGKSNQATDISQHTAGPTDVSPESLYKRFYLSIARANKVIAQVAESGLQGEEVESYIGELYALRALFHFDLARLFAKLPSTVDNLENELGIVLSTEVHEDDFIGERASLAKTYETILNDLNTALDKMKPGMEASSQVDYKNATQGHINYWATLALRARVHLYLDNKTVAGVSNHNELAFNDAKEVIEKSGYSLYKLEDYTSVWGKEFTDESLFEIKVTSLYNPQRNSLGYYTHAEGYAESAISNEFKDFLTQRSTDVRSKMIKEETDVDGKTNKGFYTQKYPGRDGQIYVNNPKVIRLSDVYLIAAEAALKSGKTAEAAHYINELRKVRIEGYAEVSSVTLDDILVERRLELNGEGHMAWDMWRNKKSVTSPNIKTENVINYDDHRAVLPIPQTEINVSHGKLQQNQGY